MKFTATLSYVLAALVASSAAANHGNNGRQGNGKGGFGGFGGGNNNNAATATAAAATASANSNTAAAAAASSSSASGGNSGNAQDSTTLDPAVIATGFQQDGQEASATPAAGQVASLTSSNNFINFCATVNKPITNGQQIQTGSCNPAPMGVIAATTNMPSSKFIFPPNGGSVAPNTAFTIQMAINNIQTGNFVNADTNYYSAPQQVNSAGEIIGHSHVTIEALSSLDQTTPTDPTKFAFFKGINGAAVNGVVTADVTDGLPAGVYRMASINAAANHQPVLVAVAQHGSLDDMVYFTVADGGAAAANSTAAAGGAAAASSSVAAAATTTAAKGAASSAAAGAKGGNNNNAGNNKNAGGKGGKFGFRFARNL